MEDSLEYAALTPKQDHNQDQWWWSESIWNDTMILCQQAQPNRFYGGFHETMLHYGESYSSILLCNLAVILAVTLATWFLLRPLHIPFTSQLIGGVVVMGILFSNRDREYEYRALLPPVVLFIMKTISFIGFIFHLFMLGVETNMSFIIKRLEKKSIIISLSGIITSLALSYMAFITTGLYSAEKRLNHSTSGIFSLIALNAQSFFLVTCSNINDLGIGNSDVGRLAASLALILDLLVMAVNFINIIIIDPIISKGKEMRTSVTLLGFYALVFFIFRPIVLYILKQTPEGRAMKKDHFMFILTIVLLIAGLGEILNEMFAVYLFALSLPEDPLSTAFSVKLDAMTSAVFFPMYCATQGFQTNAFSLTTMSFRIEFVLIFGYVGKFFGIVISTYLFRFPFRNCMALALIVCSKGLMDVVSLGFWRDEKLIDREEYTLAIFHFIILTGASMPLVRHFYEPLSQYTSLFRPSVSESTNNGTFQPLSCLYKQENLPGIIRLIEAFNPTRLKPISVTVLQLIPLTGRCTMPILAPLEQVKSLAKFRSNLASSNRIVEAFLNLERHSKGYARPKHYVSISSYESMYNDICALTFEKESSLLILPFHTLVQWTKVGKIVEESSLSIREVNKMVLEKAPCSVGILLDRGNPHLGLRDFDTYKVGILLLGGPDDQDVLAFTTLFGSHPNVRVEVYWLKSSIDDGNNDGASNNKMMIMSFQEHKLLAQSKQKESTTKLKEVVVKDGSDTTKVLLDLNGVVDLLVVGRNHDPKLGALHGLSLGCWREYPELGILGDLLATPDFGFSVLVVQKEPKQNGITPDDSNMIDSL